MARSILPNALTRREWLEEDLDPERARRIGEAYRARGRWAEAVAFLAQARDTDGLQELFDLAVEEGDVFLLREASRALGVEPSAAQWRAVAENAEAAGKQSYAAEASRLAERPEA